MSTAFDVHDYLRQDRLPTIWCPGCGIGTVVHSMCRAIHKVGLDRDKTTLVAGIGCSSRSPGYMEFDGVHTTHGRALAVATGIKLSRPELSVIVTTGDGDCLSIGTSHFMHAARRNIDLTVILFDNRIYGMTGGQHAPTTFLGDKASTARYGNIEPPFEACSLAITAGATYVARGATVRPAELTTLITGGIQHTGFSFIEVLTQCPPYYGRPNKFSSAAEMLEWQKQNTVEQKRLPDLPAEALEGKIVTGVLHQSTRQEFTAANRELVERAAREVSR